MWVNLNKIKKKEEKLPQFNFIIFNFIIFILTENENENEKKKQISELQNKTYLNKIHFNPLTLNWTWNGIEPRVQYTRYDTVVVYRKNNNNINDKNNNFGPKAEQVLNTRIRMHVVASLYGYG